MELRKRRKGRGQRDWGRIKRDKGRWRKEPLVGRPFSGLNGKLKELLEVVVVSFE